MSAILRADLPGHWMHIPFEEAKMNRQFGADYDDYVAQMRRLL